MSPYPDRKRKAPDQLPPAEQLRSRVSQAKAAAAAAQRRSELEAGLPAALARLGCTQHSLLCNDAGSEHSASVYGWEPKPGVVWDHTGALHAASAVLPEATVRASGRSHCHLTFDALKGGNDGYSVLHA